MAFILNRNDEELLANLAEYRVLTVNQLAALHGRHPQGLRRRLRTLEREQLVRTGAYGFGQGPLRWRRGDGGSLVSERATAKVASSRRWKHVRDAKGVLGRISGKTGRGIS